MESGPDGNPARWRPAGRKPVIDKGLGIYLIWMDSELTHDAESKSANVIYAVPQKTPMEIAREKNCATPNSLVEQFKREFESLWEKTASPRPGVEGEEHGALVFYEAATNNHPFVELSPGKHMRLGKTQYAPNVPAMPNIGPETREAFAGFSKSKRAVNFLAFFHTHPNYVGLPPESRSGDPSQQDEDYQRDHGNPLGIVRTGKGYSFFSNGKTFGPGDAKANDCVWQLNRARN
jgi:hypothetical protein